MSKKRTQPHPAPAEDWSRIWSETDVVEVQELSSKAAPEYVGWIDLMGAKGWMAGAIRRAAELVGVIHIAGKLAASETEGTTVYPVIDGVYITSRDKRAFQQATHRTMRMLARTFEARTESDRFLVRGGIAYGRVLHGTEIARLHTQLKSDTGYAKCLALGASIRQAYLAEANAPPFGFYVDMTARSVAPINQSPYVSAFDRWWRGNVRDQRSLALRFGRLLDTHFEYLQRKHREIEYPLDRLQLHRALAREYFRLDAPEAIK